MMRLRSALLFQTVRVSPLLVSAGVPLGCVDHHDLRRHFGATHPPSVQIQIDPAIVRGTSERSDTANESDRSQSSAAGTTIPFVSRWRDSGPREPGSKRSESHNHIVVSVSIEGHGPRALLLDTGAEHTAILIPQRKTKDPEWRERLRRARLVNFVGAGSGLQVAYQMKPVRVRVEQLSVPRPVHYFVVPVEGEADQLGMSDQGPVSGILGNDVLSQFRVTIDFDRRLVELMPRQTQPGIGSEQRASEQRADVSDESLP